MTAAARVVLQDCRSALATLTDGVQGSDWRWRWVAVVTLLRAVGHVLVNVDGVKDKATAAAIERAWTELNGSKPEPRIFWRFIDQERNNLLKEYRLGAGQGVTVFLQPFHLRVSVAGVSTPAPPPQPPRPAEYAYPMNEGPFEGRDQREVVAEAIRWWERYLDAVDASVRAPGQ
jgi:hypothetical protein